MRRDLSARKDCGGARRSVRVSRLAADVRWAACIVPRWSSILPPERLPDLVNLLARKLKHGALVAIETPNPECLAIFATHFYLDPTHTRPVPAPLLRFYLEEAGLVNIEVERLAPAVESWPSLLELPAGVREDFFGGLDYAIFARRL